MTKNEKKVLIITGGQIDETFLKNYMMNKQYSMIIAVDRGLKAADSLKLVLDFIVGDFDSVSESLLQKYHESATPILTFPTEKDKTDTQIAIELALKHNPASIELVGATGNRLDHVLTNIHLLLLPMQLDVEAYIIDSNNKIYLKKQGFYINKSEQYGDYVSLLPLDHKISGLSLRGFKYPLNNITLTVGTSLGISNEIVKENAFVEFSGGTLIVIEARD